MDVNRSEMFINAINLLDMIYYKESLKNNISYNEFKLYFYLFSNNEKELSQKDVVSFMNLSKSSVNTIIKREEKKGNIKLLVNELDKREKIIKLTDKGFESSKNIAKDLKKSLEFALNDIQIDDFNKLIAIMNKILCNVLENV